MADSFNKKERAKKKAKKKQEKAERRKQKKLEGKKPVEFMYMDQDGNFTSEKPPQNRTPIKAEDIVIGVPKREALEDEPFKNGIVKYFDVEKGYGFIEAIDTDESFFVHVNNLIDPIKLHDKVTFEVEMGPKGPIAVGVKLTS